MGARAQGPLKWAELTRILTARNLKIRYKGSVLGFFWSLLTPALTILMYAVFAHILKFNKGQPHYLQFLVSGIIVWGFTAGCLNDSLFSIAGNANLVKKVFFPRAILPWGPGLLWLLPAFAFHLALCTGIALLVGTLNVFFRDTQHVVGIGQLAWFFLTPVFYFPQMQLEAAGFLGAWRGLVFLNPMTGVLALYRRALMGAAEQPLVPPAFAADVPAWWVGVSCAMCLAVLAIGVAALRRGDRTFGDEL